MKLYEMFGRVDKDGFLTTQNEISVYLRDNAINFYAVRLKSFKRGVKYTTDLDFKTSAQLTPSGSLKVKFKEVTGHFDITNCNVSTLKGLPEKCQCLYMKGVKISSFVGISEILLDVPRIVFSGKLIKEGGLGLLQIKNLKLIDDVDDTPQFNIIQKYAGRPDDIFECQAELIENGFEEYAKI